MNVKLLITGSSGYLGKNFIQELLDNDDYSIIGIDKTDSKYTNLKINLCAPYLRSKLYELISPSDQLIILNFAAARTDRGLKSSYKSDNVLATQNFLESIRDLKVLRFIHMSSVASFEGEKLFIKKLKLDYLNHDDCYRLTKFEQEKIIKEWCLENKIPLNICYPSAIFSKDQPRNTNTFKLFRNVRLFPFLINSNAYKTLTFMPNLVKNLKYIIDNDVEGNLLAVEKPILTVSEIQSLIATKMKLKRIKISVKPFIFIFLGRVWEAIFGLIVKDPIITEQRVKKFFSSTSEYPEGSLVYKQYINFEDALENSIKK
tara:strand:- start:206 stop:1153 length:948 start_codon:yes stop_codon:yes gene_type:complete